MEFRILGPLETSAGDGALKVAGPKQRAVLAHLILRANRPVSVDVLIDGLWGEEPPETAKKHAADLRVYRLRQLLGQDRIGSDGGRWIRPAGRARGDRRGPVRGDGPGGQGRAAERPNEGHRNAHGGAGDREREPLNPHRWSPRPPAHPAAPERWTAMAIWVGASNPGPFAFPAPRLRRAYGTRILERPIRLG